MKSKICLTFDDGLLDQLKWARILKNNGIKGTFYINPFSIGNPGFLNLAQLKEMQSWSHTIANHFWIHESPANLSFDFDTNVKILLGNLACASKWLYENGFMDGADLVALPFGSEGGKWTEDYVEKVMDSCEHLRDFGKSVLNEWPIQNIVLGSSEEHILKIENDSLSCYCFHGNNTFIPFKDNEFVNLIDDMMKSGAEFITIKEVANA
jgi:hypothetical protein